MPEKVKKSTTSDNNTKKSKTEKNKTRKLKEKENKNPKLKQTIIEFIERINSGESDLYV